MRANNDLDIREFEQMAGPWLASVRPEMEMLRSRVVDAVKKHKPVDELQRQLVLYRCLELVGAA